jgi:hypothetical protein
MPYREPAAIEATAAPARGDAPIGNRCSEHLPQPLLVALVGPVLIAGVVFAVFSVLLDAPAFVGLTVSTATLVVLAWSPIRLRGQGVVLHDKGLLLSGAGHHAAVAFEDIHEVWFEIPRSTPRRAGITIRGAYAPWAEIRLVRIQPAQVVFFRRARLVPWRSVRLTRIPNPGVLCALVAQNVKDVQRDRHLIVDGA